MRLRHLQTNGATADDQQVLGLVAQLKDGFVGEIRHLSNPGMGGTSGEDPVAITTRRAVIRCRRLHLCRRDKAAVFPDHLDAEPFEPLLTVHRLNLGDHVVHMILAAA